MVSKSIIFLVKSFLGNFYRHLAIFIWSHCPSLTHSMTDWLDSFWMFAWLVCAWLNIMDLGFGFQAENDLSSYGGLDLPNGSESSIDFNDEHFGTIFVLRFSDGRRSRQQVFTAFRYGSIPTVFIGIFTRYRVALRPYVFGHSGPLYTVGFWSPVFGHSGLSCTVDTNAPIMYWHNGIRNYTDKGMLRWNKLLWLAVQSTMIIFNHLESFYSTYLFITSAADCLKKANHKFKQKMFFIKSDPERLGTANQSPLFQHC